MSAVSETETRDFVTVIKPNAVATMIPLFDRVICQRDKSDEMTASGLVIPANAQDPKQTAHVVAVGDGAKATLSVGDRVLTGKYAGTDLELNGESLVIMRLEEILAIVHDS
jgi:chaperonin GroES